MGSLDINILNPAFWVMLIVSVKTGIWIFLLMLTGMLDN